jgi:DNA (cytosine-5)-methyltransferase 3A
VLFRSFWTNIPGITQPRDLDIFIKDILEKEVDPKYTVATEYDRYEGKKPKELQRIGTLPHTSNSQANRVYSPEGKTPTLSAHGGGGGAKTGLYAIGRDVGRRLDESGTRKDEDKDIPISRRLESRADGKCGTLTSIQKDNLVISPTFVRRLTPRECERLQGLPDDYTSGISDTQRYKCLGNAFNVDVIAHILSFLPK